MRGKAIEPTLFGSRLQIALDKNNKADGKLSETLEAVEAQRKKSLENLLKKKEKFLQQTLERRENVPHDYVAKNPRSSVDVFKVERKDIEKNPRLIALERRASLNKKMVQISEIVSAKRMAKKWMVKSGAAKANKAEEKELRAEKPPDDTTQEQPEISQKNRKKSLIENEIQANKLKKQVAYYNDQRRKTLSNLFNPLLESDVEKLGQQNKITSKNQDKTASKHAEMENDEEKGEVANAKRRKEGLADKIRDIRKPTRVLPRKRLSMFEMSSQNDTGLPSLSEQDQHEESNGTEVDSKKGSHSQRRCDVKEKVIITPINETCGPSQEETEDEKFQKRKEQNVARIKKINKIRFERKAQKQTYNAELNEERVRKPSKKLRFENEGCKNREEEISKSTYTSEIRSKTINSSKNNENIILEVNEKSSDNNSRVIKGTKSVEKRNQDTVGYGINDVGIQSLSESKENKMEVNNKPVDILDKQDRSQNKGILNVNSVDEATSKTKESIGSTTKQETEKLRNGVDLYTTAKAFSKRRRKSAVSLSEFRKANIQETHHEKTATQQDTSSRKSIDGMRAENIDFVARKDSNENAARLSQRRRSIACIRCTQEPGDDKLLTNSSSNDTNNTEGVPGGDGLPRSRPNQRRRSIVSIGAEGITGGLLPQPDDDKTNDRGPCGENLVHTKRFYGRRKSIVTLRGLGDTQGEVLIRSISNDGGVGEKNVDQVGCSRRRKSITALENAVNIICALGTVGNREEVLCVELDYIGQTRPQKWNDRRRNSIATLPELTNRAEFLVCNSFE